ncbi:MAG: VWA domain-containing protein [Desulfobacterales bacterium]|nr:VWA domain-containing protein [Desulfobacterales bacterium]
MLNALTGFAACLRSYGLGVSTGEVLDCSRALAALPQLDAARFKAVVQGHFLKSHRDRDRFLRVYDLFFHGGAWDGGGDSPPGMEILDFPISEFNDPPPDILAGDTPDADTQALAQFMANDPQPFLSRIQALQTRAEAPSPLFRSNLSQLTSRLGMVMAVDRMASRLRLWFDDQGQALPPGVAARLERARQLAVREPVTENPALVRDGEDGSGDGDLARRSFANLSGPELIQVRALMAEWVRRLKDRAGRRYRVRRKGGLDLKKTLRRAARYQGVPLDLVFREQPPKRGRVTALCDVSGSVWSTARFMLQILHSLQDCFARVRSFVFVSDLAEVTDYFTDHDIDTAVSQALACPEINLAQRTDYGRVFHQLHREHAPALDRKTTLLILGDGRSNHYNPQAHVLESIRDKCRRIIWLTPEPTAQWSLGDCELPTYAAHCHEIRTLRNLEQLSRFVTELVL